MFIKQWEKSCCAWNCCLWIWRVLFFQREFVCRSWGNHDAFTAIWDIVSPHFEVIAWTKIIQQIVHIAILNWNHYSKLHHFCNVQVRNCDLNSSHGMGIFCDVTRISCVSTTWLLWQFGNNIIENEVYTAVCVHVQFGELMEFHFIFNSNPNLVHELAPKAIVSRTIFGGASAS